MSMLGGSGGNNPLQYRTGVGIRGLTTATPAHTKRTQKKGPVTDRRVDRVDRDDPRSNKMWAELQEEEQEEAREELLQPMGHSSGMRSYEDEAFRVDGKGRTIPPAYGDVDQGNLADSWLMAACAAVAHAQPAQLLKRVARTVDDAFIVRLGEELFIVKPEFPTEGYADPTPNGQRHTLWVALVEKAFALREAGSYGNLETGSAGRALSLLTGRPARRASVTDASSADALWTRLRDGKKAGAAMVLRTRSGYAKEPLVADHHFAVLDAHEHNGQRTVKLYNPWGTNGGSRPLESMVHELPLAALKADAEALFVTES